MSCPVCGNTVPQAKHPAWQKTYCSIRHRDYAMHRRRANKLQLYTYAKVALNGYKPGTLSPNRDLAVIYSNGQQRIKAAVQLQKLMRMGINQ